MLRDMSPVIEDELGRVEYEEGGAGPTIVLVPGSCSTGAAWRPIIAALGEQFRCVTTSLLGYGRTAERHLLLTYVKDKFHAAPSAISAV